MSVLGCMPISTVSQSTPFRASAMTLVVCYIITEFLPGLKQIIYFLGWPVCNLGLKIQLYENLGCVLGTVIKISALQQKFMGSTPGSSQI
mgnify:CR=1 FL=1